MSRVLPQLYVGGLDALLVRQTLERFSIGPGLLQAQLGRKQRLPLCNGREVGHDPLGDQIAAGAAEVVVEDRLGF